MALKKNNNTESNVNAATSASTPAFEGETQMENTVNTHASVETNDAPQNTVAVRQNTAVGNVEDAATRAKNFQKEVEAMKGALNLDYGSVQMFKANQGKIGETDGDKRKLGRYAQVRLLAWDDRYELSTGDSGKSSKDFLAFSKDGVTVDNVVGDRLEVGGQAGCRLPRLSAHRGGVRQGVQAPVHRLRRGRAGIRNG